MRWKIAILVFVVCCAARFGSTSAQQLAYGPNTCKNGFVFREAWTNDQTCVSPQTRQRVASDNAHAASNISPGPFGKNQCRNGLVWRVARPQDLVCVTTDQRDQAAKDNYYDFSRKQIRLTDGKVKPTPKGSGAKTVPDDAGYHPGAAGVDACKARFECPPRMKAAVDDNTCVCNGNR